MEKAIISKDLLLEINLLNCFLFSFHHSHPYDYSSSELGGYINFGKFFIDFMAQIGQVYDRKVASPEVIEKSKLNVKLKQDRINTDYC